MYNQFGRPIDAFDKIGGAATSGIAQSGTLDDLLALDRIGTRRSFGRDEEIYAERDLSDSWYHLISGTVRICKLLPDGRRHLAEFCFPGDYFGLDSGSERAFSAEAVDRVLLMRFSLRATDRLIDQNPRLARRICEMTLRDLAHAQNRMLLLGRMTAAERVANFLLEIWERRDARHVLELPMSRMDIADYLGLTIETVCRTLTAFKRAGLIGIVDAHHIVFRNRHALEAACEA